MKKVVSGLMNECAALPIIVGEVGSDLEMMMDGRQINLRPDAAIESGAG